MGECVLSKRGIINGPFIEGFDYDNYDELEYISSTDVWEQSGKNYIGRQYIDTGIVPNAYPNILKIEADMAFNVSDIKPNETSSYLFGTVHGNSSDSSKRKYMNVGAWYDFSKDAYKGYADKISVFYGNGNWNTTSITSRITSVSNLDTNRHNYCLIQNQSGVNIYFDGESDGSLNTAVGSGIESSILIFCSRNGAKADEPASYWSNARCYGFKISALDNQTGEYHLICNFVPARKRDTGVLGMYNTKELDERLAFKTNCNSTTGALPFVAGKNMKMF